GQLTTLNGTSSIVVDDPAGDSGTTNLHISQLQRQPGGTVQFDRIGPNAHIYLNGGAPALDDGLIGGWAMYGEDDFATYGPEGVAAYGDLHSHHTTLATASATDNVRLTTDQPALTGDLAVNSLFARHRTIDLGGHTLV